jgi:hypothetical protein
MLYMCVDCVLNGSGEETGSVHWRPFCLAKDHAASATDDISSLLLSRDVQSRCYTLLRLLPQINFIRPCDRAQCIRRSPGMAELKFDGGMQVWWCWPTSTPPPPFSVFTSCLSPKRTQSQRRNRTRSLANYLSLFQQPRCHSLVC